eukprot:jgi/Tetstr1/436844/TSEL_025621.t1
MLRLAAARCPVVAPSPAGAAAPLAAVLRLATATTQRELSTNTSPPTLCNADTAARGEAQGQQAELPAITPVSLRGLHRYVSQPRHVDAVIASRFLRHELPLRLRHQDASLARLSGNTAQLERMLRPTLERHGAISQRLASVELPDGQSMVKRVPTLHECAWQQTQAFAAELRAGSDELEKDVARLVGEGQRLVEQGGHSREVDRCMDAVHCDMVAWRLLVSEHLKAVDVLAGPPKNSVEQRMWSARVRTTVDPECNVLACLRNVAEDCRAFCIEKNSNSPDVSVTGDPDIHACLIEPHFAFVVTELLKNAMQPLLDRFGAWDVDEAPPIEVCLRRSHVKAGHFEVTVTDRGGGIPKQKMDSLFHWFSTSADRHEADNFGYSRNHGAQFTGIGVGVNMTRLYCRVMGGGVDWQSEEAHDGGTTATVWLPVHGHRI